MKIICLPWSTWTYSKYMICLIHKMKTLVLRNCLVIGNIGCCFMVIKKVWIQELVGEKIEKNLKIMQQNTSVSTYCSKSNFMWLYANTDFLKFKWVRQTFSLGMTLNNFQQYWILQNSSDEDIMFPSPWLATAHINLTEGCEEMLRSW